MSENEKGSVWERLEGDLLDTGRSAGLSPEEKAVRRLEEERERQRIKSPEERTAALERELGEYIRKGYTVVTRTETSAHLHRDKQFSWVLAAFLFLAGFVTFGITWLFLLLQFFDYAGKRSRTVYLTVDERGNIVEQ